MKKIDEYTEDQLAHFETFAQMPMDEQDESLKAELVQRAEDAFNRSEQALGCSKSARDDIIHMAKKAELHCHMNTTLNQIRSKSPCVDGWTKLLKHLGKTQADDEPLSLTTILDSNGLEDALWCLQAVDGHAREIRLYTVWCARQVQHLTKDQRSIDALDVAERFANGQATKNELTAAGFAARAAARAAAGDAAWAARAAAWDAARDAQEVKFREMFCDTLETKELKEKNKC